MTAQNIFPKEMQKFDLDEPNILPYNRRGYKVNKNIIHISLGVIENIWNDVNTCGEDWIKYSDRNCFKVVEKKGTQLEAKGFCSQFDSTLITIQSKEEHIFVSQILEKYNHISDNVWIGLELDNKSNKWLKGNEIKYEDWDENAVKSNGCVQMAITKSSLGKWTDEWCNKKYLIICQKKQNTKTVFSEELKNLTKVIERQENKIKTLEETTIPIGFLYTQLPHQSSPQDLWPKTKWNEITKEYSGLFFRAEGGESLPFGQTQQANQSWISDVLFWGFWFDRWTNSPRRVSGNHYTSLKQEIWNKVTPGYFLTEYLQFYTTGGEVRPKNTAIKIFKRIQ